MRSSAFSMFSIELAKHNRRYPSPYYEYCPFGFDFLGFAVNSDRSLGNLSL